MRISRLLEKVLLQLWYFFNTERINKGQLFRIRRFTKYWWDLRGRFCSILAVRRSESIGCHTFVFVVWWSSSLHIGISLKEDAKQQKNKERESFVKVLKLFIKYFLKKTEKLKVKLGHGSLRSFGFWALSTTGKIFCQSWAKFNSQYAGGKAFCQVPVVMRFLLTSCEFSGFLITYWKLHT